MPKNKARGKIRIIGGKWRSRLISFPDIEDLRPSPNRVRETVFNWLSPYLASAICLDCFAGSGALGYEALSRGAKFCVFIDNAAEVARNLKRTGDELQTTQIEIIHADFLSVIQNLHFKFDVVFLDPPFRQNLIRECATALETSALLKDRCFIYIETEAELLSLPVPENWKIIKQKVAGQVAYYLIERTAN